MASRTDPNLTDKLAAMIALYLEIPHEIVKRMSRESILGLCVWDHYPIPVAVAKANSMEPHEYNHPSNLVPRFPEDHNIKTAKIDVPMIAKAERITEAHQDFQRRLLAKTGQGEPPPKRKPKSRFGSRKLQSRPFPKKREAVS